MHSWRTTLHSSVQRSNRCLCGRVLGYNYRPLDTEILSLLPFDGFLNVGKSSFRFASRGPWLHVAVRPRDNEARATLLRASSHTCFARPAIFGDDFLRIELEETGEVVPILFPSISVVFSLALGFAIYLSLFHSRSLLGSSHLYLLVAAASLFVTLLCSYVIACLPFFFFAVSLFICLFLSLSTSVPSLRHRWE